MYRIGNGKDIHRFVEGRPLILGGVTVPFERGLDGHSDADVLTHAVADAILGALALGDIGRHFPDNDPQYKGISSLELLRRVNSIIADKGWKIENLDSVIILQKPKIAGYVEEIRRNISGILEVDIDCISVKATTSEGLGFEGTGDGISAEAVVLLKKV
ncbi:MAG: 2-C-methyl-D-erythritol 2,4-cyclodiphosphate synthase [bacterium]|nr:2-C-methyl-D-erythritol 2,4-cyclodiphosphate synthase [bacterium]